MRTQRGNYISIRERVEASSISNLFYINKLYLESLLTPIFPIQDSPEYLLPQNFLSQELKVGKRSFCRLVLNKSLESLELIVLLIHIHYKKSFIVYNLLLYSTLQYNAMHKSILLYHTVLYYTIKYYT